MRLHRLEVQALQAFAAREEVDFDALVTVDKKLRHQQNVSARSIAVVVLDAEGTTYVHLASLVPAAEVALRQAMPGSVTVVSC